MANRAISKKRITIAGALSALLFFVSLGVLSAGSAIAASSAGNGFLARTVAAVNPNGGYSQLIIARTLTLPPSAEVRAVVKNGGKFVAGTTVSINIGGPANTELNPIGISCVTAATVVEIQTTDGSSVYQTLFPVNASVGPLSVACGGTPPPPPDSDHDGVADNKDKCPGTPAGTDVDVDGCAVVVEPVDSDGDGVTDDIDQCDNTSAGVDVDENGCPELTQVTPEVPTPVDVSGVVNDAVIIPATEGAIYTTADGTVLPAGKVYIKDYVENYNGGDFVVRVHAAPGYEICGLDHNWWPFVFSNTDTTPKPTPTPTSTPTPTPTVPAPISSTPVTPAPSVVADTNVVVAPATLATPKKQVQYGPDISGQSLGEPASSDNSLLFAAGVAFVLLVGVVVYRRRTSISK